VTPHFSRWQFDMASGTLTNRRRQEVGTDGTLLFDSPRACVPFNQGTVWKGLIPLAPLPPGGDSRSVMSMYTQLLEAALEARAPSDEADTVDTPLSEALRCRRQLATATSSGVGVDRTSSALAHQVAYDISLMELARSVGINCDPNDFDRPEPQRRKLEHVLQSRGFDLAQSEDDPIHLITRV
jgi:hypothetical protein